MEAIGFRFSRIEPFKPLTHGHSNIAARNNQGRITVRHQGGGVKKLWRMIDFRYDKKDIPCVVETIEYDPNRTAFIARVCYRDGERRYILAASHMKVGDSFLVSAKAPVEPGNRLPLKQIPVGTPVYNIELRPGGGALLVRSAGTEAQVLAVEGDYAQVKLPSGEIRRIPSESWATIGVSSNTEWSLMTFGTAGRMRRRGIRPTVRGTVMNPRDHPYGGGEGRQPRGLRRPKTMWGKPVGGISTRRNKRTNVFMVKRRSRK